MKYGLLNGDIGAFLYRHVHSFHHKSYNPGPWSSLSMHPVEHCFYFSLTFIILAMPVHPLHVRTSPPLVLLLPPSLQSFHNHRDRGANELWNPGEETGLAG